MSKWKTCKIKDLGVVVTGNTPPTSKREYYGEKYVFIKPTDITEGERYVIKTEERFSELGAQKFRNAMLLPFTPCMVTIGSLGKKMCMTNQLSFTNQAINAVLVNNENDNFYVYYLLKTLLPTVKFLSNGTASGRENVSKSSFENIDISVPHLTIQKRAASILAIYDDLIENNNRRIAILEEMAQKLYREWFVHFRFPGHENVKMVESEMGMIPEGWSTGCVEHLLKYSRGKSYTSKELEGESTVPFVNLKNIQSYGGFRHDGTKGFSGKYKESQVVKNGDVVMAVTDMTQERRLVGQVARISNILNFAVISMDLIKLIPLVETNRDYMYAMFRYSGISSKIAEYANGANVLHLNPEVIKQQECILPDTETMIAFGKAISKMSDFTEKLIAKNTNLRKTRDLLLPRLISGDIDVSELDIPIKEG